MRGRAAIEAAEVKERKLAAIDQVAVAVPFEPAAVQVPVGDVVLGLANDREVAQEAGHQVEPPLVDEQSPGSDRRGSRGATAPPTSPAARSTSAPGATRHVPEVVDPGEHDVDLGRLAPVGRDRLTVVRNQHDAVASGELVERPQRSVDLDVGIEIGHGSARLRHQVPQQPRLDRRRQLEHRIAERHLDERVTADLGRGERPQTAPVPDRCSGQSRR